jgi:hypothetical protein
MPWIAGIASAAASIYGASRAGKAAKINPSEGFTPVMTGGNSQKLWNGAGGYGWVNIDPTIRQIRRQTLQNLPMYRQTITGASDLYGGELAGLKNEFAGNQNAFINARVNPLRAQIEQGRGNLTQGLARRDIFGSLSAQAMGNYDAATQRELGDQTAFATNEALQARQSLSGMDFNRALSSVQALQGLDQAQQAVVAQDLQQELASLGLGQADISAAIQAAGLQLQTVDYQNRMIGRGLSGLGSALSSYGRGGGGGSSLGSYSGVDWAKSIGLS